MWIRRLGAFLALVLSTSCASTQGMPIPDWPRYQEGGLVGFLHAPDEQIVRRVPDAVVRRARGTVAFPSAEARRELPLQHLPTTPGETEAVGYRPPDYGVVDTRMFVVELRGPGASAHVRTLVLRAGRFDFGAVPAGSYELKVTASGAAFELGWRSEVRTVIVSDSADRAAEIIVE